MSFWSKLFFTQQAITHTKNISPYTQNKAIKSEHERLMQEQYAMTHPKCEKVISQILCKHRFRCKTEQNIFKAGAAEAVSALSTK